MKIYCAGIGGIGLSAYAAYQNACGHEVHGSDQTDSALIQDLRSQGIEINLTQDGTGVPDDTELFVYTLALPEDHPERKRAAELGIPQKTYFQALGDLTRESGKRIIAVCGTHGKSSTTSMVAKVLIDAGLEPSVILGTKTHDLDGRNWRKGAGDFFLVEACEYKGSFLHLSPDIVLMTNVDGDHFDAFDDIDHYQKTFVQFLSNLSEDGTLITHLSDSGCKKVSANTKNVIDGDTHELPELQVPGTHMQQNAQLVVALAEYLSLSNAHESLKSYKGCWRRMEIKGETTDGVLVVDDYGHHPREVDVTLGGMKKAYPDRRLVCVFQPHMHSRILKLYDEFLTVFSEADLVLVTDVYDVRAKEGEEKLNVEKFVSDASSASNSEMIPSGSLENTTTILKENHLKSGDVLITMGAGDVWKVADDLLR